MTVPFSIHESAEAEINEAADFYELEAPGLGNVFLGGRGRAWDQAHLTIPRSGSAGMGRCKEEGSSQVPFLSPLLRKAQRNSSAGRGTPDEKTLLLA